MKLSETSIKVISFILLVIIFSVGLFIGNNYNQPMDNINELDSLTNIIISNNDSLIKLNEIKNEKIKLQEEERAKFIDSLKLKSLLTSKEYNEKYIKIKGTNTDTLHNRNTRLLNNITIPK